MVVRLPAPMASLSPDGRMLLATRTLRLFAYGFVSVVLAVYLEALGLEPPAIGAVFTAALAGSALTTVVVAGVADRIGRRRMLVLSGILMALAGTVFALTGQPWLLALAAFVGAISPSGSEVGPFLALEQASLPETVPPAHRTGAFAWYNLVGSFASALGALAAGAPALAQRAGLAPLESYRLTLWAYAAVGLALAVLFSRLSPAVEAAPPPEAAPGRWLGLHRSRGVVARLSLLFAVDAFAGGLVVQGFVAYWFHTRHGVELATLGAIFFLTNTASALSFLAAARIAARIGLLNTMVFTHLPSNVLLALVPAMPTAALAVAVLVLRHALSQMDVPTRQSYTVAVVAPDERAAAAGFTSVARNAAASVAPALAGVVLQTPALGLPFLIAGGLKCVYDLSLLATFRNVRPPEEAKRRRGDAAT